MTFLLWLLGVTLVVVGFAGIIFPALPGTVLIFAGLLIAAGADGFTRVGLWPLMLIGVLGVISYAVDFVAAALGARGAGASRRAVVGAALGTLLGLPFGLPGVVFGPLAGALAGEWSAHRDWRRAGRVGMAAWIGFLIGTAVKIALAFSMVAIFLLAVFFF
ncbi:MAG TPA: DUF456 family protein [Vicinamibacterales bacterium]|nr:DUF456 family protein [Vicinamibacterales bacterium]